MDIFSMPPDVSSTESIRFENAFDLFTDQRVRGRAVDETGNPLPVALELFRTRTGGQERIGAVGSDPDVATILPPDVTGLSQANAEAAIIAAGLTVGRTHDSRRVAML